MEQDRLIQVCTWSFIVWGSLVALGGNIYAQILCLISGLICFACCLAIKW
jgi:hypothetical protein